MKVKKRTRSAITNCQKTNKQPLCYLGVVESSILKVFAGSIKIYLSPSSRHLHFVTELDSSTAVPVVCKNSSHTTPQTLNSQKEQNTISESLTMRAIQAFIDTEDEWAGVYANLAES